jgi:hypothetical protein
MGKFEIPNPKFQTRKSEIQTGTGHPARLSFGVADAQLLATNWDLEND